MASEKLTLPAAPRHLRPAGLLRPVDSNAFSTHYAAKVPLVVAELVESTVGSPKQPKGLRRRRMTAVESSDGPGLAERKAATQRTKRRVALSLVLTTIAAVPLLVLALVFWA